MSKKQEKDLVRQQQGTETKVPEGSMCDVIQKHRIRTGRTVPPKAGK